MSIDRMSAVWGSKSYPGSKHTGSARFLLVAIADNASDDGFAWPGLEYLHKKTAISKRHISRLIKGPLYESGELWLEQHYVDGDKTHYIITIGLDDATLTKTLVERCKKSREEAENIVIEIRKRQQTWVGDDTESSPQEAGGDDTESPLGMTQCHGGDDTESSEPSCNPHLEPSILTDNGDDIMSTQNGKIAPITEQPLAREPIRVDLDQNGDEVPGSYTFLNDPMLRTMGQACNPSRKDFRRKAEEERWQKIRQWVSGDPENRERWVYDRIARAKTKGWKFPGLLNALDDRIMYGDWLAGRLREDKEDKTPQVKKSKKQIEQEEEEQRWAELFNS